MTQQRTYSHRPLETCFHGYADRQKPLLLLLLLLFLPPLKHCDCVCEGYTLYCIYAMWSPRGRRSWWWVTTLPGGTGGSTGVLSPVPSNLLWFRWRRPPDGFSTKPLASPVWRHPECCFNPPRVSLGGPLDGEMRKSPDPEEIVAIFRTNLDSEELEPLCLLNSVALMIRRFQICKVHSEAWWFCSPCES